MAEHMPGDPDAGDRFVRLDDGDMHVVEDGKPGAPALLLIHGTASSTAWWDPVVPSLAGAYRVIRVDLLGHGRSASPAGGYDIPTQARRAGAALDSLGAGQVTVIGHSMGCMVATALAEQRPGTVTALALIDMGPSLDAYIGQGLLSRLMLAPLPGRLLWRLKTEATIRKAMRVGFTRPVEIPDALIEGAMGMTHRAFAATDREARDYLGQRSLPDRLAALGLPVLVIFGTDDRRWRSSSAAAYRSVPGARVELLPGVGHTPMLEDPQTTGELLLDFAGAPGTGIPGKGAVMSVTGERPCPSGAHHPGATRPGVPGVAGSGAAGPVDGPGACTNPAHGPVATTARLMEVIMREPQARDARRPGSTAGKVLAEREKVWFPSGGTQCAAWHYRGSNHACVIMAGGLAVTKEPGTDRFARRFHDAGFAVLAFDYRRLGESGGQPRQVARISDELADWQAAIAYASTLPDVDPARLAVWGFSSSGGHIFRVAARNPRLAAAIAQAPNADGPAAARNAARYQKPLAMLRFTARGVADWLGSLAGRPPRLVPLAGEPGTVAVIVTPDGRYGGRALNPAGAYPGWQQAVAARSALRLAFYRPGRDARKAACPLLVLACDQDQSVLAAPAIRAAQRAPRGELVRLPGGHYAPFLDGHEQAVTAELAFVRRHLLSPLEASHAMAGCGATPGGGNQP